MGRAAGIWAFGLAVLEVGYENFSAHAPPLKLSILLYSIIAIVLIVKAGKPRATDTRAKITSEEIRA